MNAPEQSDRPPLQWLIKGFSSPVMLAQETGRARLSVVGGTALFWHTVEGHFIVSAAHVWRELLKRLIPNSRASICVKIGTRVVSLLDAEVIAIDDDFDLVVLRVPGLDRTDMKNRRFYRTAAWPLEAAVDGERLGLLGYPGRCRASKGFKITCERLYLEDSCSVARGGARC